MNEATTTLTRAETQDSSASFKRHYLRRTTLTGQTWGAGHLKSMRSATLRLYRDEFNRITRLETRDHYDPAATDFHQKFGARLIPNKGLVVYVR